MFTANQNDDDFVALWKSTAQFFAYYVILARKYSQFYTNPDLLLEYLRQRGLKFADNETHENLIFMMKNFYDRIRQRGTLQIITKASIFDPDNSDSDSDSSSQASHEINGELLQSIGFNNACDDFIFNLRRTQDCGWCMRSSSPLYRGTATMESTNKIWSPLLGSSDWKAYPRFGSISSIRVEIDESDSNSSSVSEQAGDFDYAIQISNLASGIGLDQASLSSYSLDYILKYGINVNPNIDYEFNFRVKVDNATAPTFDIGINAFDCQGNPQNLNNIITLTPSVYFVQATGLRQPALWYFFRGIIYSQNRFPIETALTTNAHFQHEIVQDNANNFYRVVQYAPAGTALSNSAYFQTLTTNVANTLKSSSWNCGNNLQFTSGVRKIIPFVKVVGSPPTNRNSYIGNINLKPCSTNYSTGFIQTNNWIDIWLKNNNQNYKYEDLYNLFIKYLLPYDCTLAPIIQLEQIQQQ